MTETPPTLPKEPRVMTLIYIKAKYSNKLMPVCLVDNEDTANAITALIKRGGATDSVIVTDVPIWPNIKAEED